jgi:diketogulonate reductase-like aldo/keto reductase
VTADSPLTQEQRLAHPVLGTVAATVARTPAQVLFRWGLQQGCVVLPKSVHPARLAEHAAALEFTLDAASMAALDALAEGLVTGWDPRDAP